MTRSIAICVLLITVTMPIMAQTAAENLHRKLDSISNQKGLVGFGVSIFSADDILYQKGYGYAELKNKKPYTVHTVQNIGSISKTFIGVALMKAIEQDLFTIDTPVNDILPFALIHPRYPETPITIAHLASHTSGIYDSDSAYDKSYVLLEPEKVDLERYDKNTVKYMKRLLPNEQQPLGVFLEAFFSVDGSMYKKKNFLKWAPGERYNYSNMGAALAAYCVELASGKSFREFTKEHIFENIDVDNMGWSYEAVDAGLHAEIYADNGEVLPHYTLNSYPDGGLRTSVHSLTIYAQEMIRCYYGKGELLTQDAARAMMTAKLTKEQYGSKTEPADNYGYFWEHNRNNVIGHNGGDPGIVTLMYYYEDIGLGGIFFTNSNGIDTSTATRLIQASWNAIREYQRLISQ